jgi:hypothetical protein
MSSASQKRLRLSIEIRRHNTIAPISCDRCFASGHDCYVMPSSNRLKCAECVRVGRPCVNLSWESLDKTRAEYEKKVEEDEKLLADVIARLLRNKKILAQAKDRAAKKAECLANELEESGEDVRAEEINCPAADALTAYSPAMWSTLDFIDTAANFGTSQAVAGNS